MKYKPNKHHRRSIRLKGYDYSQAGLYFITLCCQDRKHFFGTIQNGEILLNKAGKIVKKEWENTPSIRQNTALHEYIIMPNHFHAIIEILFSQNQNGDSGKFQSPSQTIGAIIRGFKGASTKRIKEYYFSDGNSSSTGELQFAPTSPNSPQCHSPQRIRSGNAIITNTSSATNNPITGFRNTLKTIPPNGKTINSIKNHNKCPKPIA